MANIRVSSAIAITDLGASKPASARYVVTNEATGRHFSADPGAVAFLETLRRTGSVEASAVSAGIAPAQAGQLLGILARNGVVAGDGLDADKSGTRQPIEGKIISLKFDLLDASRLARRLTWLGRILFSAPMALVWAGLLLLALAVFLNNLAFVQASLAQGAQAGLGNWVMVALLFVGIKAIHELGHILAFRVMCLREGFDPGPIRIGLMVFAATPFPFTDVTSAWRLASRWRRAAIGAAGIYVESLTVALLVLAWSSLDLGAFGPVILQVAVFSGALTLLFNLNPAVKLDGYYILTDLMGQPNLAGRASAAARAVLWRALGAEAPRPGRAELGYWVVSYLYRWTIFASVFWLAYRFDPRLGTVIALVAAMLLVVRPLSGTIKPVMTKLSPLRAGLALAGLAALAVLAFVPFKARLLVEGQ
ncbi:MAG: hypothetical protein OXD48_04490, partial [Litoreibacter sp.]|nr:hypothetical protein [Litoreibacter sp.]